jgi:radical SAM protein with 4Fe4S-binding SPASM domain
LNQKEFFWQSCSWFFAAQAVDRLARRGEQQLPFSKGCMMGASEGHVGPDGKISICDKAQGGRAFVIGNVNEGGWDFEKIDELNRWLHDCERCSTCFARRFCDLCFEKLEGDSEALDESRARYCRFARRMFRAIFQLMLEVMDRSPRLWDEAVRYINKRVKDKRIEREEWLRG